MLGHRWDAAFEGNGWGVGQRHVRQKILQMLEWETYPAIPSTLPSLLEFETVFPRSRWMPLGTLLGCHRARAQVAPPLPPPRLPPADEPIASRGVWHGRLRSNSHLAIDTPAAVSASGADLPSSSSAPAASDPWRPSVPPPRPKPGLATRRLPLGRPLLLKRPRVEAPSSL